MLVLIPASVQPQTEVEKTERAERDNGKEVMESYRRFIKPLATTAYYTSKSGYSQILDSGL